MSSPHRTTTLSLSASVLLLGLLGLVGCSQTPPRHEYAKPPAKWMLGRNDVVHHRVEQGQTAEILSIKYSSPMPVPLGDTFVTDLVIGIRNPAAPRTYEITTDATDDDLIATLARAPEVATRRTGLLQATGAKVTLSERGEGAFAGNAWLQFTDPDDEETRYVVIAHFDATRR